MKNYDASSITWLKGLEGLRAKAGMYIGATDSTGVIHLAKEIIGNSIDESVNGHGSTIGIKIDKQTVTIFDNGRGIPNGPHPKHKSMDTLTILATQIHAGGKLGADDGNYEYSSGTHGLGLAVVNALSSNMQVWSLNASGRPGVYTQTFSEGKPTSEVTKTKTGVPTLQGAKWHKRGTIVEYTWDKSVFDKGSKLNTKSILEYVKAISFFTYHGADKKRKPVKFMLELNGKKFTVERGNLKNYIPYRLTRDLDPAKRKKFKAPDMMKGALIEHYGSKVDLILAWSMAPQTLFDSAVNSVPTVNHGTHYKAACSAIEDAFQAVNKRAKFRSQDLILGTVGCLNIRIASPKFDSQAKVKLISKEATKPTYDEVFAIVKKWISKNKSLAKGIVARAVDLNKAQVDTKLLAALSKALKDPRGSSTRFPSGYVGSTTRKPDERELSIVEGKSAGGSGKKASDRYWQEVLPLRGKMLNVARVDNAKMVKSEAILGMLKTIGYNPRRPEDKLRIGTINVLSDPDPDGPVVGSTVIPCKINGVETTKTIKELSELWTKTNAPIEVLSGLTNPDGSVYRAYMQAYNIKVTDYMSYQYRVLTESGASILCTPGHKLCVSENPNIEGVNANNLTGFYHVRADNLVVGQNLINLTTYAADPITRITSYELPDSVEYYCMTVPLAGNFLWASNEQYMVSSNCHITSLVLTVLWKTVPHLFDEGRVFVVNAPLFVYNTPKQKIFGSSLRELMTKVGRGFSKENVSRLKGYGEADPDELRAIAFDTQTRMLTQVTPPMAAAAVYEIMGSEGTARKELLGLV